MIRVMHEADPYGFFVGRAGETIDPVAFSRRIAVPGRDVKRLIIELGDHGVYSTDQHGRIYCRRMIRTHALSLDAIEKGKQGGNPALLGANQTKPQLKLEVGSQVKHAHRMLDARDERLDNSDSLRSSAVGFGQWPTKVERLRALALIFIAEFANCRDPLKSERYTGAYVGFLAAVRGRGLSIEQAWQACVDAREACGGRPLFAGSVRTAMSFLPTRETPNSDTAGESPSARYRRVQGL